MLSDKEKGQNPSKTLSIVASVYNEAEGLELFHNTLSDILQNMHIDFEVIFVNDGSSDGSDIIIDKLSKSYDYCKAIHFSRNYGHEAAMIAGIDNAKGEAIICMDADLQHPPSSIPDMYQAYREGTEIINMIREDNADSGFLKSFFSKMFYRLLNKLSPVELVENASDFFLISHRVADILRHDFRERNRFIRGFIQIIGFKKSSLTYSATSRQYGKSKYSFFKLLKLSFNAVVSFSKAPLHLGMIAGIIFALLAVIVGIYSIIMHILGSPPPGYTTIVVFISFAFSVQFFLIGFIGIYVGYNFEESKKRPIYIIDRISNNSSKKANQ
ncbi:MAG: glycosyltransferase family 2 protein [Bacteroidales bacterium]